MYRRFDSFRVRKKKKPPPLKAAVYLNSSLTCCKHTIEASNDVAIWSRDHQDVAFLSTFCFNNE